MKAISLREGDLVQDATALPSVEDIEQDSAEAKETFDKVEGVEVDDDSVETSSEGGNPAPEAN